MEAKQADSTTTQCLSEKLCDHCGGKLSIKQGSSHFWCEYCHWEYVPVKVCPHCQSQMIEREEQVTGPAFASKTRVLRCVKCSHSRELNKGGWL